MSSRGTLSLPPGEMDDHFKITTGSAYIIHTPGIVNKN